MNHSTTTATRVEFLVRYRAASHFLLLFFFLQTVSDMANRNMIKTSHKLMFAICFVLFDSLKKY